jgi:anti-sigma B factor antagonist
MKTGAMERRSRFMPITVQADDSRTVLSLSGDLDRETGPGVYLTFQRELSRGAIHFIFDLHRVDLMDSAGLGVLVRCYRDARMRGGLVVLERVPEPIRHLLEFTRLDTILLIAGEPASTIASGG